MQTDKKTSVILAGGVARGAFEAGALKVLSEHGIPISHVVAASSGALNGVLYAAAIRAGRENEASKRLIALWQDDGDWCHAFDFSAGELVKRRGIATTAKLVQLMRREVESIAGAPACRPTALTLVAASVDGDTRYVNGQPIRTFERTLTFTDMAFDSPQGRERVYAFAAASAAFPGLFAPVNVDGIGPCFDGGLVNNSPIGAAIDQGAQRIILIAPSPAAVPSSGAESGIGLISQVADILVGERLFRDLRQAERINFILEALEQSVCNGTISAAQFAMLTEILGWRSRVELICIRPSKQLAGSAFSGFFDRGLRTEYISQGRHAAQIALAQSGLL
ncbi:MAG: Patatin [bacterium]|nr:Patatin [bacterium]